MPPKPKPITISGNAVPPAPPSALPKPQLVSAAVKAAAAAGKIAGSGSGNSTAKQPPKKKKTIVKAKRPGSGNSPVVVIGKDDTLHPPPSKLGVMKNRPVVGKKDAGTAAVDKVQFSSQYNSQKKKSGSAATSSSNTSGNGVGAGGGESKSNTPSIPVAGNPLQLQQFKLERAQIARRELAEMDAIERAFREDSSVWAGPTNVVFPRRYHAENDSASDVDEGGRAKKKNKDDNEKKKSPINNPYMAFYGSQSQGWMYGEGYAGIGGRSWMEATLSSASDEKKNDKKSDSNATSNPIDATSTTNKSKNPSFLIDDVSIIENALRSNGLTRNDATPRAYACFLEQARRYALELLADAQDYAIHAQRNTIPTLLPADLLLAAEMGSALPTPEAIADLASEVNRAPLPPIPTNCYNGVALPPVEQQLTARTYDVVNGARVAQRMMRGGDLPLTMVELGLAKKKGGGEAVRSKGCEVSRGNSSNNNPPPSKKKRVGSYGAGKGRQISVHIKSKSSVK